MKRRTKLIQLQQTYLPYSLSPASTCSQREYISVLRVPKQTTILTLLQLMPPIHENWESKSQQCRSDTHEATYSFGSLLWTKITFNPLNPELNPICYLLALLGTHHFLHVSRIRVKSLTLRRLMSYIYGAPILDVSRSHTTTQHSR